MTDFGVDWAMWASIAIAIIAISIYMLDRIPMELTSAIIIILLLLIFSVLPISANAIEAEEILRGFGNPALITIMALLVVGQGLFQTGALDHLSRALLKAYDARPTLTLIGSFSIVFFTSAFINNTPVVIMFLPIMTAIAQRMEYSPSKLLLPLSYISVFAGMTTLIGTSTNLLAAESYYRLEGVRMAFFDLAPIGLILAFTGCIYLTLASRVLLPNRVGMGMGDVQPSGRQFIVQIEISKGHPLEHKKMVAGLLTDLPDMTVRMVQRGTKSILPPFDDIALMAGDLLIIATTRTVLTELLAAKPEFLQQMWQSGTQLHQTGQTGQDTPPNLTLSEIIVAPGSRMINRTIEHTGFRYLQQILILGVQRRSRMIRSRLDQIRLEAGDTMLICGKPETLRALRANRDLLLLEWSQTALPAMQFSKHAQWITLAMISAAAFGVLPILHSALFAAIAMIASGCLNIRQATRALDFRIFMLVGAALALGSVMEQTGAAHFIANLVVNAAMPYGVWAVISILFITVAVVTNLLSNSATAVLFTPIAIAASHQMGVAPEAFVLTVIYAANCCFATPIAYQTNLLVMGPGRYKFGDFIRFGTPLIILLWAVFTLIAPKMLSL